MVSDLTCVPVYVLIKFKVDNGWFCSRAYSETVEAWVELYYSYISYFFSLKTEDFVTEHYAQVEL